VLAVPANKQTLSAREADRALPLRGRARGRPNDAVPRAGLLGTGGAEPAAGLELAGDRRGDRGLHPGTQGASSERRSLPRWRARSPCLPAPPAPRPCTTPSAGAAGASVVPPRRRARAGGKRREASRKQRASQRRPISTWVAKRS